MALLFAFPMVETTLTRIALYGGEDLGGKCLQAGSGESSNCRLSIARQLFQQRGTIYLTVIDREGPGGCTPRQGFTSPKLIWVNHTRTLCHLASDLDQDHTHRATIHNQATRQGWSGNLLELNR